MTGTSRRSISSRRSSALALVVICAISAVTPASAIAQSGRNRDRPPVAAPPSTPPASSPTKPGATPPVEPEPPEPEAPPIPPGGLVAKQVNGGPVTRYVLRNGFRLLVRENPATELAALRLVVVPRGDVEPSRLLADENIAGTAARLRALGGALDVSRSSANVVLAATVRASSVEEALPIVADLGWAIGGPDGALLVVDGRVIPYNVLVAAQHAFGAVREVPKPAAAAVSVAAPPPPPPPAVPAGSNTPAVVESGLRYELTRGDTGIARVTVAYDASRPDAGDGPACELVATALGEGLSSRLGRALRMSGLATDVSARYVWDAETSELRFEIATDPKQLDAAEAALFREIDRFRRERIADGELQRARNAFELSFRLGLETVEDEASELARFDTVFGEPRALNDYVSRVRAVTSEQVQRAASIVLSSSRARVSETLPKDAPARTFTAKAFSETVLAWAPSAASDVKPTDVRTADGPPAVGEGRDRRRAAENEDAVVLPIPLSVRDFSTLNGPKAFVREDQSRPLLSIGFFYPAGRAAEAPSQRGVTELLLRSMLRGSKRYSGERLALAIEQLGGRVRIVNEADFFGVIVQVLSRNAEQVFPIAADLVQHPSLDKADVLRERDILLSEQTRQRSLAAERTRALFWQTRYPAHAYGVSALGLPATVATLTDEQVRDWFARSVRTTFPLVAIVGDTDGSSLVSRFVADGFDRPDGTPPPTPGLPAPAPPSDAIETLGVPRTTQTIGFPAPGGGGATLEALDIAMAAVEERVTSDPSLGVAVSTRVERRRLAGAVFVTATSAPADEQKVRERVAAAYSSVAAKDLTAADLTAAQARAIVVSVGSRQRFSDLLVTYIRDTAFGVPLDTIETYSERIPKIPIDVIRKVATVFSPQLVGRGVVRGTASER